MSVNEYKIRSAKRSKNEKTGVHNWHPYYAGYSENFVEDIINLYNISKDDVILDPWLGSGTTTVVAQKRGINSVGVDINPVMTTFSKAKINKITQENLINISERIIVEAESQNMKLSEEQGLDQYLTLEQIKHILKIKKVINNKLSNYIQDGINHEYVKSFYLSVLFRCIRHIGNFKKGSNPTWIGANADIDIANQKFDINQLFLSYAQSMKNDIEDKFNTLESLDSPLPTIFCSDAKSLDIEDRVIDYIITSPPYLTRIDYAVSTKPELLFLSSYDENNFNDFRKKFTGAPTIIDKNIEFAEDWGPNCLEVLHKISEHPAKASKSYYLPFYLQYFRDMFNSIKEIYRVLKNGGKAFLVVQTSYFKEVEIQLGEILIEMAQNVGLKTSTIKKETVKQHIAHVNTKSSFYVKNKIYYEECILFEKEVNLLNNYANHRQLVESVEGVDQRTEELYQALSEAFKNQIKEKTEKFICFGDMTVEELAKAFHKYPIIIKSVLSAVNVANRAIKRDLDISFDTYSTKIDMNKAGYIAGYIKPLLPNELAIPALCEIDRHFYVDKEIRKYKGSWEKEIINQMNEIFSNQFKKRKFTYDGEKYELDGATPTEGKITVGVDVKRIEAKQDTHKRADEIVNKAEKFKRVYPEGQFYAVVYYPFTTDHVNLESRLKSKHIDGIYFAGESTETIIQAVKYILGQSGMEPKNDRKEE